MKVLLLGSGGREHALAWKIAQSPKVEKLYIAPGNAGTSQVGENVDIKATDFAALKVFALERAIDMIVVGPEDPLVQGIFDYFKNDITTQNIAIIGPSAKGAQLEGSKEFAKEFMKRYNIPTARYKSVTAETLNEGLAFLETLSAPYVLKADGLCAGKGVLILPTLEEAQKELKEMLKIGIPAGLQGMVFSLANVCIQSTINSFGSNAVAGSAAALNFEFFSYFMVNAFAQATVTFTSQNYGAGEHERCRKIFRTAMLLSMVSCGCLSMIFVLGRDFFLRLYTTDTAVLGFAMQRLTIVTTLELLTSTYEISAGAMRGRGHSLLPAVITVFGSCVLRLIWISTACRQVHEFWMLMIIYPISWVVTGTAMIIAYARMERKEKLAA